VLGALLRAPAQALAGLADAVRSRPGIFTVAAVGVFALDILVPPILLSLVRKPADFFTFNPWLAQLPRYLWSGDAPIGLRVEKVWNLALFWFSADNPYGVEWGFAVTTADLARFALTAAIVGAYFALWFHRRAALRTPNWRATASAQGGVLGAAASAFGLATGGCTVMGCGAPVIPVVGLAFSGLSSTALTWLARLSTVATTIVLLGMSAAVLYLGWRVGAPRPPFAVAASAAGTAPRPPSPA